MQILNEAIPKGVIVRGIFFTWMTYVIGMVVIGSTSLLEQAPLFPEQGRGIYFTAITSMCMIEVIKILS